MRHTIGPFAALLLMTAAAPAYAQVPGGPPPPSVTTEGQGIVKRAPDRAWVSIATESRARTPREAQRLNADAMSAVMQKLKDAGVPADAIQTSGYNLQPEFDYANGRQSLRGYVVRNAIEVKVDDLPKLGQILEVSVGAGATSLGGVRFDIKDRSGAEADALRMAVQDARTRADAAAAGAGMRIERVIRIEEHRQSSIPQPRPMLAMRAEMTQGQETPVAPGELEITASVTLTALIR